MTKRSVTIRDFLPGQLVVLLSLALLALAFAACESQTVEPLSDDVEASGQVHEFIFEGFMDGYYGVGGDIDGVKNPVLEVNAGDEVTIHLINGERMAHDIAMRAHGVTSDMLVRAGEETSITFVARGDDVYYCTVPGHEQAGMVGSLKVRGAPSAEPVSMK